MRGFAVLAFAVTVAGALAGCAGSGGGDSSSAPESASAPTSTTQATGWGWHVGDWWTQRWFLDHNDTNGLPVQTVVAENRSGVLLVAASNATIASFHGAFIFPTFGLFGALGADVGELHWPWYRFPLVNGQSGWSDHLSSRNQAGKVYSLPVSIQATIRKGTTGANAVWDVVMRSNGKLVGMYDYSMATHWFTEARFYDSNKTNSGPDDWVVRIVTDQSGTGYKGPYFDDTGTLLLDYESVTALPAFTPTPSATFTMAADQNKLLLLRISFAAAGAEETTILDPNKDPQTKTLYHQEAYGQNGQTIGTDLVQGYPGQWQVVSAGGGLAAGSIVFAYGIHEQAGQL